MRVAGMVALDLGHLGDRRPDEGGFAPRLDITPQGALEPDRADAFEAGLDHGPLSSALFGGGQTAKRSGGGKCWRARLRRLTPKAVSGWKGTRSAGRRPECKSVYRFDEAERSARRVIRQRPVGSALNA